MPQYPATHAVVARREDERHGLARPGLIEYHRGGVAGGPRCTMHNLYRTLGIGLAVVQRDRHLSHFERQNTGDQFHRASPGSQASKETLGSGHGDITQHLTDGVSLSRVVHHVARRMGIDMPDGGRPQRGAARAFSATAGPRNAAQRPGPRPGRQTPTPTRARGPAPWRCVPCVRFALQHKRRGSLAVDGAVARGVERPTGPLRLIGARGQSLDAPVQHRRNAQPGTTPAGDHDVRLTALNDRGGFDDGLQTGDVPLANGVVGPRTS